MPVLEPSEYDISYFDGALSSYTHNAGYTRYGRWERRSSEIVPVEQSTGEFWSDVALFLGGGYWNNKSVLEIGCAKGYIVQALRNIGINAYGIDVSSYAIGEADVSVQPYLTIGDARTYLANYSRNQWDWIYSRGFLQCISDEDLPNLISELDRVSKSQLHQITMGLNPLYYNNHDIDWWIAQPFPQGTIFIVDDNYNTPYIK